MKGEIEKQIDDPLLNVGQLKDSSLDDVSVNNGLSHPYHLDESSLIFRGIRSKNFFSFLDELSVSKQYSP